MLHKAPFIIAPETFRLTQQLQALPELESFHLVGGTSLALQLGHRNSIDIGLFSQNNFDDKILMDFLKINFEFKEVYNRPNTIIGFENGVKVDFITHNYPYILPPITEEGITYLSKEDIAAMKLQVIYHSGKRLKDFIDIYFLLEHFSIKEMLNFFCIKYPLTNPLIPLKALNYFDDIDENIDPPKLFKTLPIKEIKKRIDDAILHSNKKY